jgi:hypothetical protein
MTGRLSDNLLGDTAEKQPGKPSMTAATDDHIRLVNLGLL